MSLERSVEDPEGVSDRESNPSLQYDGVAL